MINKIDLCKLDANEKINQNFSFLENMKKVKVKDVVSSLPIIVNEGDTYIFLDNGIYLLSVYYDHKWNHSLLEVGIIYYVEDISNFVYLNGGNLKYLFSDEVLNIENLPSKNTPDDLNLFVLSDSGVLKNISYENLLNDILSKMSSGSSSLPVATVIASASENVPAGFLLCDGRSVSRTQYSDLFNEIGTSHGQGDGNTTFNIPDYRERFLRMVGDNTINRDQDKNSRTAMNIGGNTGAKVGSIDIDRTKVPNNNFYTSTNGAHTHTVADRERTGISDKAQTTNGSLGLSFANVTRTTSSSGDHGHTILGGDNQTAPINAYINYFIKF